MTSLPIISQSTMIISMYVIGIKCLSATSTKCKRCSECASLSLPNVGVLHLSVNLLLKKLQGFFDKHCLKGHGHDFSQNLFFRF